MKAWAGEGDFPALLKADPEVTVEAAALAACFDPAHYTKQVDAIFARVLETQES